MVVVVVVVRIDGYPLLLLLSSSSSSSSSLVYVCQLLVCLSVCLGFTNFSPLLSFPFTYFFFFLLVVSLVVYWRGVLLLEL